MPTFRFPQITDRDRDTTPEPADALDIALDNALDGVVDESQAALIESVCGSIPVATVRVSHDAEVGPRAWKAEYLIRDAENPDLFARPPIEYLAITRADRDGPSINASELDVLAIELDTLAADPEVAWQSAVSALPDGGAVVNLSSAIGVSGTERDRLLVEFRVGACLRHVTHGSVERILGLLYRLFDFGGARFEL